jgi:hypothetical protein
MAAQDWTLAGNSGTNPPDDFLGTSDNQPLDIKTNGQPVMHLDTQGNVGIGSAGSAFRLQVAAPNQLGLLVSGPQQGVGGGIQIHAEGGGGWELLAAGAASAQGSGKFNIRNLTTAADALTIDAGANTGIGTVNPGGRLHVSSGADFHFPQVVITQTTALDFARLEFRGFTADVDTPGVPVPLPFWDIAAGRGNLNFFRQDTGNIMTLTSTRDPGAAVRSPRVGIGTETPATTLHVNGTATVDVLAITGGADIAEPFVVAEGAAVDPGTVLVIDSRHPGRLKISESAYDTKVAGVVSGARNLSPGLILDPRLESGERPVVALTGRVYCKAEALSAPIVPGDLLTTSAVAGHAMKATDTSAARGAVLGKAMSGLSEGTGMVLLLVNLQ